jgi:hypothetical protein
LSIQPDTIEISYLLNTGMLVWHAETAQDFFDWILKGLHGIGRTGSAFTSGVML